jgi:hypothetical protein
MEPWPFEHMPGNTYKVRRTPAEEAYYIASHAATHADAVSEIVRRGLAADMADADQLIRDHEEKKR